RSERCRATAQSATTAALMTSTSSRCTYTTASDVHDWTTNTPPSSTVNRRLASSTSELAGHTRSAVRSSRTIKHGATAVITNIAAYRAAVYPIQRNGSATSRLNGPIWKYG